MPVPETFPELLALCCWMSLSCRVMQSDAVSPGRSSLGKPLKHCTSPAPAPVISAFQEKAFLQEIRKHRNYQLQE